MRNPRAPITDGTVPYRPHRSHGLSEACVATRVGGIPEIVEHEVSGILVDPDDPDAFAAGLRRVLTDSDLGNTIAGNGYSRVRERFGAAHNGTAYVGAFGSLLAP